MSSQMSAQQKIFLQHSGCVRAVAFSPNGDRLLTGGDDNKAAIWSVSNGESICKLRGHTSWVRGLAWSPSGESVITGSEDKTVRIWRSSTGELLAILRGHRGAVLGVDWSASGGHIATASLDNTAKIWDPSSRKCIQTTEKQSDWVWTIVFSPNGEFIVTGSADSTAVVFSPNGEFFATSSLDNTARIFRIATSNEDSIKPLQTLQGHAAAVWAVAWSPTGDLIATGSGDRTVWVWEASTGAPIQTLKGHSNGVCGVAWSPRGDYILTGSGDRTARIWDAATGETLQIFTNHANAVIGVAWSPKGDHIATASGDGTASIIQMAPPIEEKKTTVDEDNDNSKMPSQPLTSSSSPLPSSPLPSSPLPSQIPKSPSKQQAPTKLPLPPQTLSMKNESTDESKIAPNNFTVHSMKPPEPRCFKNAPNLPFDDALTWLLHLRECPKGRPDLANNIPDDDDIDIMLKQVNIIYGIVEQRAEARKLIRDYKLTTDEVKAIVCYTMDSPYKVYAWLNAWLMTNRQNETVRDHVAPFFTLLYRGMEKLPRIRRRASRGVLIHKIQALCNTFDNYKIRCKQGSRLSFWGLASFSTSDDVMLKFTGGHTKGAIVYSCENLECVSISELSQFQKEEEVMPLPPSIFKVIASQRIGSKLVIGLEQMDHYDVAYVIPKKK